MNGRPDPLRRSTATTAPVLACADPIGSQEDVRSREAEKAFPLSSISSTYDLLSRGASRAPDSPAMSFFLRTPDFSAPAVWSHREWFARITQTANMLRILGLQRKDVVAFILPNLPETHWTIWGGEAAGSVFAINPLLEPAMMLELMKAVQPKFIVTLAPTPGTDIWQKVSSIAGRVPHLKAVLTVSPLRYLRGPLGPIMRAVSAFRKPRQLGHLPVHDFHSLLKHASGDRLAFQAPSLNDVASYFCTGGTTGTPKVAVRNHRTEVANVVQLAETFGNLIGPEKTFFCGLPLFHVNAQLGTGLLPWSVGGHVVLGTPMGYRGPGLIQSFWRIVEHYRLYVFSGVPTVYSALLQVPRGNSDISSIKYGICGAAPMPVELFNRFQQETGIKILEGYGLTEGGCVSSINPPTGKSKVGAIGLRLPWQTMKAIILDAAGNYVRDAEVDEIGTIAISGQNLFAGYLNSAHNKGIWLDLPSGTGGAPVRWLNTGDLGRMDAEGYFWLTGRSKELIIRGGHNIDPKMIEEPIHAHPDVALAAAVGRPDRHAGEVPVVYVQLRPGASATADEILVHAQESIAERAAWPKQVKILGTIPTTAVGKIFKPALTEMEIESVFREEATAMDARVTDVKVIQDPHVGMMVRWSADGDAEAFATRLGQYTFHNERV